jgi:glycosyltransferase involved in cell wall biosynthesis
MRIHIVARDIQRRDAVGNFCRQMAALLQAYGAEVRLAAENCHPDDRAAIPPPSVAIGDIRPDDVVFFHFSTEDPALPAIAALPSPKVLYFHNITPDHFFTRVDPHSAGLVRQGLAQRPLAARFDVLMANSHATARVLHEGLSHDDRMRIGLSDIIVCTPIVGADRWSAVASEPVRLPAIDRLVLFVGRVLPHKGVDDLVRGFAALAANDAAVGLAIVGAGDNRDARRLRVQVASLRLDIARRITFFHDLSEGMLRFLYDRASVCVSLSTHEGFGVPLVDAIVFDKPLVIRAEGAMMETAGDAALVVTDAASDRVAAALAAALNDAGVATRLAVARKRRLVELRRMSDGRAILDAAAAARRSKGYSADAERMRCWTSA